MSHALSGSRGKKEPLRDGIKADSNHSKRKHEKQAANSKAQDNRELRKRVHISCTKQNALDLIVSSSSMPAECSKSAQSRTSVKDEDLLVTYGQNGNGVVIPKNVRTSNSCLKLQFLKLLSRRDTFDGLFIEKKFGSIHKVDK